MSPRYKSAADNGTRNNKGTYSQKHIDLNHKSSLEHGLRIVKA